MRLIRKTAIDRDLAERRIAAQHQPDRHTDPAAHDVRVRGRPKGLFESAAEVGRAAPGERAQVGNADAFGQMRLDERVHTIDLPARKPTVPMPARFAARVAGRMQLEQ